MPLFRVVRHTVLFLVAQGVVHLADGAAEAQAASEAGPLDALALETNEGRRQRMVHGMGVLLGWSAVNLGTGTAGAFTSEGPPRYLHQMNVGWNLVNAAIGGFGLAGALREDPASFGPLDTLEEGRRLEKILLLNLGLNVAYMATGAFLLERGLRRDDDRLRGFGVSLILQGGFLLVFDSVLFWSQHRASRRYLAQLRPAWTVETHEGRR